MQQRIHRALLALALLSSPLAATPQSTPARAEPYAVENVRLSDAEDAAAVTLILRDGRIESIQDVSRELPPGLRKIDGAGRIAVPAFLDAFERKSVELPEAVPDRDRPADTKANVLIDMREANRKGVRASMRAADLLDLGEEGAQKHRAQGFAALLAAPGGELLAGTSCLATTRDAALRDVIVNAEAFQHGAFSATGSGYPSTLMGFMAQLRQLFVDAQRHAELERRQAEGRPGRRPAWDADLLAARALLAKQTRLVCEADTAADIERWVALADEFGFELAIAGGREAWRVAELLAERQIPVILTLSWGDEADDPHEKAKKKDKGKKQVDAKDDEASQDEPGEPGEPDDAAPQSEDDEADAEQPDEDDDEPDAHDEEELDWEYQEPLAVREERRRLWEEGRDCALRLTEAGVDYSLGSGKDDPKQLLERARSLVEAGLDRDVCLTALTSGPARLLGVQRHFGRLEAGQSAALALWTKHPLDEDAKLACLFVDGFPYEFEVKDTPTGGPDEDVTLTGTWTVSGGDDGPPSTLIVEMDEAGEVTGQLEFVNPMDQSDMSEAVTGSVSGKTASLSVKLSFGGTEVELSFEGDIDGDEFRGTRTVKFPGGEQSESFDAQRDPEQEQVR